MSAFFKATFGTLTWTPPAWAARLGRGRLAGVLGGVVSGVLLIAAGYWYYQRLPQPLRVGVQVEAPGVTPVVDDELRPQPLRLTFDYLPNPDATPPGPLSAARLDLVGNVVDTGIAMQPSMAGRWRFETDNLLVFEPSEDWPAGREYRVRLDPGLFAGNVELASRRVFFKTPAFDVKLDSASFYQHPEQADERRVVASFGFTHPVSRQALQRRIALTAQRDGREEALDFSLEYGVHDRSAALHSAPLAIPERSYYADLAVAKGVSPARGDGALDQALQR